MGETTTDLGRRGEAVAAAWLTSRGWRILAMRWRATIGELDLVCRDPDGWLVGVEVKVRRSERTGTGADSVTPRRVARMRLAIAEYASGDRAQRCGIRLDLVELTPADDRTWRLRRLPGIGRGWG